MVAVLSEMGEKPIKCQFYEVVLRFTKLVHSLRDLSLTLLTRLRTRNIAHTILFLKCKHTN